MYARPYATKRVLIGALKIAMGAIAITICMGIATFFTNNKTFSNLTAIVATTMNLSMLALLGAAQLEARFWARKAKNSQWQFEDKKETLSQSGNHMIVGIRWDDLDPQVLAWCRENCKGHYGVRPWVGHDGLGKPRIIWFSNGDDAFHFKMRWL